MNFTIDPASISIDDLMKNIRFLEKKQNIIMQGDFTKIMYSVDILTMNGIYLLFPITTLDMSKNPKRPNTSSSANPPYHKNLIWYQSNSTENEDIVKYVEELEKRLITLYLEHESLYSLCNNSRYTEISISTTPPKKCVYSLYNQLMMGYTRVYRDFITEPVESTSGVIINRDNPVHDNKPVYVIKVSGVWETTTEIGITYKFIEMADII